MLEKDVHDEKFKNHSSPESISNPWKGRESAASMADTDQNKKSKMIYNVNISAKRSAFDKRDE